MSFKLQLNLVGDYKRRLSLSERLGPKGQIILSLRKPLASCFETGGCDEKITVTGNPPIAQILPFMAPITPAPDRRGSNVMKRNERPFGNHLDF
jgi:hypothetical protein